MWPLLTLVFWALSGVSCTTITGAIQGPKEPERLYYVLRPGNPVPTPSPLPTHTDIHVEWHFDDQSTSTALGYRGWDFDRNGRFDMVEVFDSQGQVQTRIFDFDGDGVIDETKSGQEMSHATPSSTPR
jgi:hypothetical protein